MSIWPTAASLPGPFVSPLSFFCGVPILGAAAVTELLPPAVKATRLQQEAPTVLFFFPGFCRLKLL